MPAKRHPQGSHHRFRPHRHRPGLRVRLLGNPGLQGPPRPRLPDRSRQLQSGDHHDRPGTADVTYIEPLNLQSLTEIIENDVPMPSCPTWWDKRSQPHLRTPKAGVLEKYGVQVIGVRWTHRAGGRPDRLQGHHEPPRHRDAPKRAAYSVEESGTDCSVPGIPRRCRPAYTMGGTGGGLVYNSRSCGRWPAGASPPASWGSPHRGVCPGLGGTGARSGSGFKKSNDYGLFYRECRRHGGTHGGFLLHGPHAHHQPRTSGPPAGLGLRHR